MCTQDKDSPPDSRVFPCPLRLSALNIPRNTRIHLGLETVTFILINTYTCKMNCLIFVEERWHKMKFGLEKILGQKSQIFMYKNYVHSGLSNEYQVIIHSIELICHIKIYLILVEALQTNLVYSLSIMPLCFLTSGIVQRQKVHLGCYFFITF